VHIGVLQSQYLTAPAAKTAGFVSGGLTLSQLCEPQGQPLLANAGRAGKEQRLRQAPAAVCPGESEPACHVTCQGR
jgi:hypothetical protein